MRIFNRRQRVSLIVALVAFLLVGLFPPWRYLNGRSAGFHFVGSPPPWLPDSLEGKPAPEYTAIHLIPLAMYDMQRKGSFTEEERRRPYLDARKMLGLAAIVFLGIILSLIGFNERRSLAPREATPPEEEQGERDHPSRPSP